jgi:anti-sigma-K factor RskA
VASTRLVPLPDHTGSGAAEVLGTGSSRVLQLDVTGLTRGSGFYEVWLLDADAQRLVSLGLLEGSTGRFPLPPQVDVTRFPVVDVSLEPADGNPAHSGDSVVRGTLTG